MPDRRLRYRGRIPGTRFIVYRSGTGTGTRAAVRALLAWWPQFLAPLLGRSPAVGDGDAGIMPEDEGESTRRGFVQSFGQVIENLSRILPGSAAATSAARDDSLEAAAMRLQAIQRGRTSRAEASKRATDTQKAAILLQASLRGKRARQLRKSRAASTRHDEGEAGPSVSQRAVHSARRLFAPLVRYREAKDAVRQALDAHASALAGSRRHVVVTELLGSVDVADAQRLELSPTTSPSISLAQPGCAMHFVGRRACIVVSLVWIAAAAAGAGLVALGNINASVQTQLFEDNSKLEVMRNSLVAQLPYSDSSYNRFLSRRRLHDEILHDEIREGQSVGGAERVAQPGVQSARRLSSTCPVRWEQYGPLLGDHRSVSAGYFVFEIVYGSRDDQPLLDPVRMQQILVIETALREWMQSVTMCGSTPSQLCHCEIPDSALNYLVPSVSNSTLIFDGRGYGNDVELAQAGLKCAPALSQRHLHSVVAWLVRSGRAGFFSTGEKDPALEGSRYYGTGGSSPSNVSNMSALPPDSIRYMRTRITLPLQRWNEIRGSRGIELADLLNGAANNPRIRVYSDVVHWSNDLPAKIAAQKVLSDAMQLLLAVCLIMAFMYVYFHMNLLLALLAISQISLSFPIMGFIVDVLLRQRPLSVFAGCSLFVVTGVSADNIFVVHETWQQAFALKVEGRCAPLAYRIRWTLAQAARPLFVADVTTAFSLFINCASPLPAIFQFGLCGGTLILVNFVLVLVYMPALLVLEERGWLRAGRLCLALYRDGATHSAHASTTRSQIQHSIQDRLFQLRWLIAISFMVFSFALLPSAIELFGARTGDDLQLFGEGAELPPHDLVWHGRLTSDGGPAQLATVQLSDLVLNGWTHQMHTNSDYTMPRLNHALWPVGGDFLAALLVFDAVAAALHALHQILRVRIRVDPAGRQVRKRYHLNLAAGASLLLSSGLSTLAGYVIGWKNRPNWALNQLGCDHPFYLNTLLAIGLGLHTLVFGGLSAIFLFRRVDSHFPIIVKAMRITKGRVCAFSAAVCLVCCALVIYYMYEPDQVYLANGVLASQAGNRNRWRASWIGMALAVLLLAWTLLLLSAGWVCLRAHTRPGYSLLHLHLPIGLAKDAISKARAFVFLGVGTFLWSVSMMVLTGYPDRLGQRASRLILGACLLLSSVPLLVLAKVCWGKRSWWLLKPTKATIAHPRLSTCFYTSLGILSTGVGAWVLGDADAGQPQHGSSSDSGSHRIGWKADWAGMCSFVVLLFWVVVLLVASRVWRRGLPLGPFAPPYGRASMAGSFGLFVTHALVLGIACTLLICSSAQVVSHHSARLVLGSCLLISIGPHVAMAYSLVRGRQMWFVRPFGEAHVVAVCILHCAISFGYFILALGAFGVISADAYATPLAIVLLIDCGILITIASVIAHRRDLGCFGHLGPIQVSGSSSSGPVPASTISVVVEIEGLSEREMYALLFSSACAALCLIVGTFFSLLAVWPQALAVTCGRQVVAIAFGGLILAHTPFGVALTFVFAKHRSIGILQPVSWSRTSRMPWLLVLMGTGLLLAVGTAVLTFHVGKIPAAFGSKNNDQSNSSTRPTYRSPDALTLSMGVICLLESVLLVMAAKAQAIGRQWLFFRPSIQYQQSPLRATAKIFASMFMLCLGSIIAHVACTSWVAILWRARAVPIMSEIILVAHASLACIALRHLLEGQRAILGAIALTSRMASTCGLMLFLFTTTLSALILPFIAARGDAESDGSSNTKWRSQGGWECYGTVLLLAQLLLLGTVLPVICRHDGTRSCILRRCCLTAAAGLAGVCGMCYAEAATIDFQLITLTQPEASILPPTGWLGAVAVAIFSLLHLPPVGCLADVALSGRPFAGFGRPVPQDETPRPKFMKGMVFLILASLMASSGACCLHVAFNKIEIVLSEDAATLGVSEAKLVNAERCELIFGVEGQLRGSPGQEPQIGWTNLQGEAFHAGLLSGFEPESQGAQVEMALLCDLLRPGIAEDFVTGSSPLNSAHSPTCIPALLREWTLARRRSFDNATSAGKLSLGAENFPTWPVPANSFTPQLQTFLAQHPHLRSLVGFTPDAAQRVSWMKFVVASKFPVGLGSSSLVTNPDLLRQYQDSFTSFFEELPLAVRNLASNRHSGATGTGHAPVWAIPMPLAPANASVLTHGWPACKQFSLGPTVRAFLNGVTRAIIFTPAFALVALLVFLRDVFLCYAALHTIIYMIIAVMGILHHLGLALGPIESLSFAVVIGVSVDYLTHFAYAYKHSIMREQYYKSRAVFLARSGSVSASAITTLCAVLPLLNATLLPLKLFGIIFTVVALVSVAFAMGLFNALLGILGPGEPLCKDTPLSPQTTPDKEDGSDHFGVELDIPFDIGARAALDPAACTATDRLEHRRDRVPVKI